MRRKVLPHLTYANVMVTLLAFVVLGGGAAYAANEWTGTNIVNESLTGADVKGSASVEGSLTGFDVKANSLRGADVFESTLTKVPSASDADLLNGKTAAQVEGARAAAVSGGTFCPGDPVVFCQSQHNSGVAYVVEVAEGIYCVGVDGITPAEGVALVQAEGRADAFGVWRRVNSSCSLQEFEVVTGTGNADASRVFTIVIL